MSVSEIKSHAREAVKREGRGASAISLIKIARSQLLNAKHFEATGDLKQALASYIKTAGLAQLALDSKDLKDHRKEFNEFMKSDGKDLSTRTRAVEEKLKGVEGGGGTIADRVRALQDNGLSVKLPTPPVTPPTPHSLVSPATLGPPSPASSPSSSPQIDISAFSTSFPSIDELDEHPAFALPQDSVDSPSPLTSFRNYAVQIERPASTPIPPLANAFASRPPSPTKSRPKQPLPHTNSASPKDLLNYIQDYNVLLIDVRNREDFDREHIQGSAVICVEPTVLKRANVSPETLEDSLALAPPAESTLFENRDKFDLVAVYDQSSVSFADPASPLSVLVRVISEQAFKKYLKRMPMMLVGGLDAWKRDLGDTNVIKADLRATPELFFKSTSNNPFAAFKTSPPPPDPHQIWNPRPRPDALPHDHRPSFSLDATHHIRNPADHSTSLQNGVSGLARRPAMTRPPSSSISFTRTRSDLPTSPLASAQINGFAPGSSPITYPSFPRPTASGSSPTYDSALTSITSPPAASINPSALSRRRSDFIDQSQEALSALSLSSSSGLRSPDYPELMPSHGLPVLRPPPAAAVPGSDRMDNRPRLQQVNGVGAPMLQPPKQPRIPSDYPVTYWTDVQIGTSGLKNLGNTCYMNAPIQCLSATVPFARFFTEPGWKNAINMTNALGSRGELAKAFAKLVYQMWGGEFPFLTPIDFRKSICLLNQQYIGSDQHDSQEFLSFMLDGIHEDLNRVLAKTEFHRSPEEEEEFERLPLMIASDREWRLWKARNDSLIVDLFQGQFRSRLECLTCHKTSTTYNVFSILQLPIPQSRSSKVAIQRCLDALFNEEVLEHDDSWDCPRCKQKRRATKTLALARLPPILLIHLKRFEANGRFSDKIDTFVEYPVRSLDLTTYMPPPLPPGADKSEINGGVPLSADDPRSQLPPYKYDLYAVTNHYGNLSSGHYTAYIGSRGGWLQCDDSSVKPVDPKHVVNQKAYVLFYKRVRAQ